MVLFVKRSVVFHLQMSQRTTKATIRPRKAQPVHPSNMARVLFYPSLDSLETARMRRTNIIVGLSCANSNVYF